MEGSPVTEYFLTCCDGLIFKSSLSANCELFLMCGLLGYDFSPNSFCEFVNFPRLSAMVIAVSRTFCHRGRVHSPILLISKADLSASARLFIFIHYALHF